MGKALIRVGVGSILFGIAVASGFVLSASAIHAGSADIGLRDEHSRISGTAHRDVFPLRAPIESQAPVDHVRVAGLEPHVGSDAVTNEPDLLEAVPASGWWNESFDERFPGLATQEFPSDLDFLSPSDDDRRTAIYDIAAGTVYLPNGRRLEAHSGLGKFIDDPRRVHVKNRGATPPNVYNLSLRKKLFHGVRAIRLAPVDESRMYGRDGMLAHSYLHGSNGQSNGCVAFTNYPEFLNVFLEGEVTRLVVVKSLESPPEPTVASGSPPDAAKSLPNASDRVGQYAAAD
ncbi:MAG: DUF2778 domain-containing protein [Rhodoplanes sp.]